ncbi:uncharacterized protein QC763_0046010 [Podospora pseudopauciseta]|uniref:Uncharacterized protein n=1 Tax=Podospora pseudopauciseta TaxID=2093780 RepID=A0ABR0HJS6_9PEZI|nr:hypothetical protein QC763_0046010 [Podospora pseudopauciseta]
MSLITGSKCFCLVSGTTLWYGPAQRQGKVRALFLLPHRQTNPAPKLTVTPTMASSIQLVLEATNARDDPRFLARGVWYSKPRGDGVETGQEPGALLAEFTKACEKKKINK